MLLTLLLQITEGAATLADTAATHTINAPVDPTQAQQSISLLDFLIKGGPVMYPIGFLSLLSIYIFVERYIVIKKAGRIDPGFMSNINAYIISGNIEAAKGLCRSTRTPIAKMIEKGLVRLGRPIRDIEASVETVGKLEVQKLEKNLSILGIIAGIAPMFGFVGTIIGVIKIFYNISLSDNISIGLIAGGLYEKMVTSASGLIIGIFAYVGYHYLSLMTERVIFKMESTAVEFVDLLQEPSH